MNTKKAADIGLRHMEKGELTDDEAKGKFHYRKGRRCGEGPRCGRISWGCGGCVFLDGQLVKKTWLKLLADVHVKTWQGGDMQIQTSCSGQNWSNIMADHGIFYCQICLLRKISTHVVHFALCPKLDPRFIRFHEFHATTIT